MRRTANQEKDSCRGISDERPARCRPGIETKKGDFLKRQKIFVLVKNFEGVNHDAELYKSFKDAKKEFREYAGFRFNKKYTDPISENFNEKFSETKIYELNLPDFLELRKNGVTHEESKRR